MSDDIVPESLGARIRRLRTDQGLSQDRLALESRVDQSALSKLERQRQRMGEIPLRRLAATLKLSFDELVAGTDYT
jgi:transcriptional regulator with XRE-family HTH domain